MKSTAHIRPSVLPKLALCGHYMPEVNAGAAADRGTALDGGFREGVEDAEAMDDETPDDGDSPRSIALRKAFTDCSTPDDNEAVVWAIETARALAGGCKLESREEFLRVACGIQPIPAGTADLLCQEAGWSSDLKSGMVRDYLAQQACYALGFMLKFGKEEWTVYLLYCDQRKVERLHYTLESAETIIHDAMALYHGNVPPEPNEYCGWCANRFTCTARKESLGLILPAEETMQFDLMALPDERLRDFILACGVVDGFKKEARRIMGERLLKGVKVPGVTLTNRKGSVTIPVADIALGCAKEALYAACGSVSEATARELWTTDLAPFPSDKLVHGVGSSYPTIKRPKKPKTISAD